MGNYRFRFSWFYTSNNKITKTQPITTSSSSSSSVSSFPLSSQPAIDHRKSYYFTRDLTDPTRIHSPQPETNRPDPKRKPTKKKKPISQKIQIRRKLKSPELNPAAVCGCRTTPESSLTSPEQSVYEKVDLPPIITKPGKQKGFGSGKENEFGSGKWVIDGGDRSLSVRVVKEGIIGSPVGKVKGNSYSPRLGNRVKVNGINGGRRRTGNRRSLSESLAVVKTSVDPGRDFKESMVEMIMENNIKSSKDLEDLLACYLALNSDEYHDLIIKVFKQIWFESSDIRL